MNSTFFLHFHNFEFPVVLFQKVLANPQLRLFREEEGGDEVPVRGFGDRRGKEERI